MKDIFNNDDTFLARWLDGKLSKEEFEEFKKSDEYAIYNKISDKSSNLKTESWQKDLVWQQIKEQGDITKPPSSSNAQVIRFQWMKYAVAAALIFVVGYLALIRGDQLQTYQTFAAEMKTIDLPDGSKAYLNAESQITLNPESFEKHRELELDGEVFFDVKKGSKFKVITENGDVRVLGTSFNVWSREKKLIVDCYSGRVGVSIDDFKNEKTLVKGEKIISEQGIVLPSMTFDNELTRPEWRDGRSKFSDADFGEVIKELERQFDIQIETDTQMQEIEKYNGGFAHKDLDAALDVVFSSMKYDYKIDGEKVILSKKK